VRRLGSLLRCCPVPRRDQEDRERSARGPALKVRVAVALSHLADFIEPCTSRSAGRLRLGSCEVHAVEWNSVDRIAAAPQMASCAWSDDESPSPCGGGERMRLLLTAIIGLVVAIGPDSARAQVATANPAWALSGSRSYEESSPGLGTSQHFSSRYGTIDVYSYGRRRSDWLLGTGDPQFAAEFSQVLAEIRQAAAQGLTSNLVMGATRDVTIAGQQFRTAAFSYDRGGRSFDSAVHLTAKGGQLLKYRISVGANSEPGVVQLVEQFIAGDLPSRPLQPLDRSGIAASAAGPIASLKSALEGCRARQAAQAPRIGPVKDAGGFIKTQELGAQYRLETPRPASPSEPVAANVEIATSLVSATASTEEAVKQIPLSVIGPDVTTMVRHYRFQWTGGHWLLTDASLNLNIKGTIPGTSLRMQSLPMKDKKIEPSEARKGSDAGASCVQAIESL
jgi:hypothetical protein